MTPDLKWMIGRSVVEVEKKDYTWFFRLDDGIVISTEDCWRLVTPTGITVTSEDQGQQFGLASPIDAAGMVKTETNGKIVNNSELDKSTGDLTLSMESLSLTFSSVCLRVMRHGISRVVISNLFVWAVAGWYKSAKTETANKMVQRIGHKAASR